ncbi:hypothetical protein JR316_0007512 [Psilocybe cubensis]|uniref:Uncharacterized protein n=2 Tax=Psilocybe cubensis TaxID=181762 RepID=A0ACB8GYU3_PSICU|nr:hypothetical protein JR316_0007512 [Psilocybe cubensis]KAH9480910.1 hypothetical protein JR316_0007512 [Psilocybe cubensis]
MRILRALVDSLSESITRSAPAVYIRNPKYDTLSIEATLWNGDPFFRYMKAVNDQKNTPLIAGIGVEVATRRRNKFAGFIKNIEIKEQDKGVINIDVTVNQALGNCPKYIVLRELEPRPTTSPVIQHDHSHLSPEERLSDEAIALILASDTVFFGTTYSAEASEQSMYPSHLGMNHRGGRPGFIRVKPSDGRTVVLPDFSGNRFMTSLGNVEATPFASLTFIDFKSGNILYLTGKAKNVYGADARAVMPFQDLLTEIHVTGYTYVVDALPVRVAAGYVDQLSPYSPPIRLLSEEVPDTKLFEKENQPKARLAKISTLSPSIAIFEWEASEPLSVKPGQAIILDFSPLLGSRQYQHMSPGKPSLVNDDFIRTWTISNTLPQGSNSRLFALTMREKTGGVVTGALFNILRKLTEYKHAALEDARVLSLDVNIVGINGDFILPPFHPPSLGAEGLSAFITSGKRHLYWFAGGIGITPFLSMLAALSQVPDAELPRWEITLIVSTREPDVSLSLISRAIGGTVCPAYLKVHIFTNAQVPDIEPEFRVTTHTGRIDSAFLEAQQEQLRKDSAEVFICGPESFEKSVLEFVGKVGADIGRVRREGFAY